MNTLTINQKMFIAALVGFIIGAAAVWVWSVAPSAEKKMTEEKESSVDVRAIPKGELNRSSSEVVPTPSVADKVVTGSASMVAVAAQPAGSSVAFSVTLAEPGWVAIHEDRAGNLGNILGAQWLPVGNHAGSVELLRATEAGKTYYAVVYTDNGDKQFSLGAETRLVTEDGNPVSATFLVQ